MSRLKRYNGTDWEGVSSPTLVNASDVGNDSTVAGVKVDDALETLDSTKVPTSRTINGTALTSNVVLDGSLINVDNTVTTPVTVKDKITEHSSQIVLQGQDIDALETTVGDSSSGLVKDVNALKTYSTTEQVIGTWINNKPIYRKVVVGNGDGSQSQSFFLGAYNVDIYTTIEAYIIKDRVQRGVVQCFYGGLSNASQYYIDMNSSSIILECGSDMAAYVKNGSQIIIIIEYTKTTD